MSTVIITGGTGLIGKELISLLLEKGHRVIVFTRQLPTTRDISNSANRPVRHALWNPNRQLLDPTAIQEADYIIHLAGAGVAEHRWTKKRKKEIQESRILGSQLLVESLRAIPNQIKAVLSASAIGWYGGNDPGLPVRPFVESDPASRDFLGETCRLWEESIRPVSELGKRLVLVRTGIVLSNLGGALTAFKRPLRYGMAAILGNGEQKISWIHIRDLCRIYLEAITRQDLTGVYNAVAPHPVSNKYLTLQLAKLERGRFFIPLHIPGMLLKLILGEMSIEVLKSTTVASKKIHDTGFRFIYPGLEAALAQLHTAADPTNPLSGNAGS